MRVSRGNRVAALLGFALMAALMFSAMPVDSVSSGVGSQAVGAGPSRGCTCHSPAATNTAAINFQVDGLGDGYYKPLKSYTIRLSFTDTTVDFNASPEANHGGFNVAASAGTFALNSNSSYTPAGGTKVDFVQVMDSGTQVTHTKAGDVNGTFNGTVNLHRTWSFEWKAPAANASDVTFDILVNAVNGDNTQSTADRWSRAFVVLPGQPGASTGDVDISQLGVPLRAYWLGVIGILSTMVLLVFSFYVIRSGSKFYEYGLPRGQVKNVKIRTIPPPKNKGAYVVLAGLVIIDLGIVLTFGSVTDEQLDAFKASMFLLGFFGVLALSIVYYVRAFLPIVDVMEEESVEALK
jgi:hypothetical protein